MIVYKLFAQIDKYISDAKLVCSLYLLIENLSSCLT